MPPSVVIRPMSAAAATTSPSTLPTEERERLLAYVRSPEVRARHERIRAEIEAEKPELIRRGVELLFKQSRGDGLPLRGAMSLMQSLRKDAGVSLTDLAAKAGMQKSSLSRLENEDRNPTVRTLERIAAALGKRLVVRIEDLPESENAPEPPGEPENPEASAPAAN